MRPNTSAFCISAICFLSAGSAFASSNVACVAFDKLESAQASMETLVAIETRLQALRASPDAGAFHLELSRAERAMEIVFNRLQTGRSLEKAERYLLTGLATSVEKLTGKVEVASIRRTNTSFDVVLENPQLARTGQIYDTGSIDPRFQKVAFGPDVIEQIFWNDQPFMQTVAGFVMRTIRMPSQNERNSTIWPYVGRSYSNVYVIRIKRGSFGRIKFYGFLQGGVFHVVTWSEVDHTKDRAADRFAERTARIEDTFKKTGEYR